VPLESLEMPEQAGIIHKTVQGREWARCPRACPELVEGFAPVLWALTWAQSGTPRLRRGGYFLRGCPTHSRTLRMSGLRPRQNSGRDEAWLPTSLSPAEGWDGAHHRMVMKDSAPQSRSKPLLEKREKPALSERSESKGGAPPVVSVNVLKTHRRYTCHVNVAYPPMFT
jgi:hypothetical protein